MRPRTGGVAAVVLAAGSSTRMGRNKMLLELDGESVVRRAIQRAVDAGLAPVLVVTGHQREEVANELDGLDCTPVYNEEHATGIHTSVRTGISRLPAETRAAIVMLADMPFVTSAMLRELVAAYRDGSEPLVISAYGDVNAPPMLYDRSLFDELRGMQRRCGREVIRRHRDEARVMSWPTEALADLDTPEDYRRVGEQLASEVEMLSLAASLTAAGKPFAVATVVRREAPSSANLGDTAIVTRDGRLQGFIGGSCTRSTVVRQALETLADNQARLISFRDEDPPRADDIVSVPTTCHSGGSVKISIDPVFPAPRLALLGSSPINEVLAGLGEAMGYTVQAAVTGNTPAVGAPAASEDAARLDQLRLLADRDDGVRLFALVATMGESDEDMLEVALSARPDYVGVIASRRRMEEIRATLGRRGVPRQAIEAIDGPAGLDIGATRPEEIAVGILAKIVAVRRGADDPPRAEPTEGDAAAPTAEPTTTRRTSTPAARASVPATQAASKRQRPRRNSAPDTAVDPVCGMSVVTDGFPPQAEHDGRTYYFCCGGCRDRFLEDPETHLAAAGIESATWDGEQA